MASIKRQGLQHQRIRAGPREKVVEVVRDPAVRASPNVSA